MKSGFVGAFAFQMRGNILTTKSDLGVLLPGGKTGILLLHDICGSAAELRAHANAFARSGYTVSCPQLIGLGDSNVPGRGSAGMLVSEAEQALARLKSRCDHVTVVGMAYGAMLALELARHNSGAVQAVVLVEPRAWLPALPFALPVAWSGKIKQTWLAGILALGKGLLAKSVAPAALRALPATGSIGFGSGAMAGTRAELRTMASLLDSVHSGLPSIRQPVMLMHRHGAARTGRDGSFLLQRRLGGRVESVMLEEPLSTFAGYDDRGAEVIADRGTRFIVTVLDEIETRRGNELRRQKVAAGRTNAA